MGYFEIIKRNGQRISLQSREPFCTVTSAVQNTALMGDDNVQLSIASSECFDLVKGDKIIVFGNEYTIRTKINRTKNSEDHYTYEATFYGVMFELMKSLYRNTDASGKSTTSTFDLTYTIKDFVRVLIYNLNRDYPNTWVFDEANCPDTTPITIQFSKQNCLQVLQTLCSKEYFNLEFRITQNQGIRTIHIGKFGSVVNPPADNSHFEWGKGLGLYQLKETKVDDKAIITRLWVEGGTTNIKSGYRNYSERLQLPYPQRVNKRAHTLADGTVVAAGSQTIGIANDEDRFFEDTTLKNQIGSDEDAKEYDKIFPKRTGTVTSLVDGDINSFIDANMDFDLNERDAEGQTKWLIGGVTAKINFITGKLAGQQFELKAEGGYNHTAKKFTLIPFADERGLTIPTTETEAYRIMVGDQYNITDINLPKSYEEDAEEDLWYAGLDDFNNMKQARAQYQLTFAREYFIDSMPESATTAVFNVGDYVPVKDDRFGIEKNIRIQKISRNLLLDHDYNLTLSDTTTISVATQLVVDVMRHEDVINVNRLKDLNKAKRGWRTTEELRNMVYDTDGYFDTENIRPNSIDTNMLTVGSQSQQFVLTGIILAANAGGNGNRFTATGGLLSHLTIEEAGIKNWTIQSADFTLEENGGYYLFAKCSKSGSTGVWYLSQDPLKFETVEDPNNYYFQVGILSSYYEDGFRDFVTTYGFTRINGNTITTGKIVTSDGECFLDLDGNRFRIGDANSAIDWNVTAQGQLTLMNVLLKSGSGELSNIGVYRGEYDKALTYFKGDEVTYTHNGATCTYRYKNIIPTQGILPTNSSYWDIVAKGADGKDGEDGKDGSDGVDGTNGTDGADGVGVSEIKNYYLISSLNTGVTTSTAGWSTSVKTPTESLPYLWNYEEIVYTDGHSQETTPSVISKYSRDGKDGSDGVDGTDGKGIESITEYYQVSSSNSSVPTSWVKNSVPTLTSTKKYLWKYEEIKYTDGSKQETQAGVIGVYGDQGERGIAGEVGADGRTSYVHFKYSDDGGLSFTANNGETPGAYMGQYTDFEEFDSGDPTMYSWVKCTGEPGAGGVDASAEDYYEYRYAKNGSTKNPPALTPTDVNPAGWGLTIPETADLEYVWHIMAKKSGLTGKTTLHIPVNSGESGSLIDASGNGYGATMGTGASVVSVNSRYALNLPANAECAIPYDLPFGENFTLCFWMRTDQSLIRWMLNGFNGRDYVENSISVTPNTWYHFAFRFNGNSVAVIVDGVLQHTGSVINKPVGFSLYDDNLFGSNIYFDEVRILRGALPMSDIERVKAGNADALIQNWSTPVRITPYNGKDGSSPALVYRGEFDNDATYYGTPQRVDAVKSGGMYYVARTDAGAFIGGDYPTGELEKWNEFGTQFEAVATGLLLAENANIAGWIFRNNRLESADGTILLDGVNNQISLGNRLILLSNILRLKDANGNDRVKISSDSVGDFSNITPNYTGSGLPMKGSTMFSKDDVTVVYPRYLYYPLVSNFWEKTLDPIKINLGRVAPGGKVTWSMSGSFITMVTPKLVDVDGGLINHSRKYSLSAVYKIKKGGVTTNTYTTGVSTATTHGQTLQVGEPSGGLSVVITNTSSYTQTIQVEITPKVRIEYTGTSQAATTWLNEDVVVNVNSSYAITSTSGELGTVIGPDGMKSVFGNGYLFFDSDDFVVQKGLYALRISPTAGIKISKNGAADWIDLI